MHILCPGCNFVISEGVGICPNCGLVVTDRDRQTAHAMPEPAAPGRRFWTRVGLGLALAWVVLCACSLLTMGTKRSERTTVAPRRGSGAEESGWRANRSHRGAIATDQAQSPESPLPTADDVRLEVVELIAGETGVSVKVAADNVGRTAVRVALWPYVVLADGTRAGRSRAEGPVLLDVRPGKRSFVLAPIGLAPEQVREAKDWAWETNAEGYGVEKWDVRPLKGPPLTPQFPGRTRRTGISRNGGTEPKTADAFTIIPGKSLGPVHLGMTAEQAMAAGSRAWTEACEVGDPPLVVISWPKSRVLAHAEQKDGGQPAVFSARTENSRFRLKGTVAVGGSYQAARKALGDPSYYDEMEGTGARAAWPSGVWLDVDTTGKIICIGVDFDHGLLLFR